MGAEFPERCEFSICKCALIPSDDQIQKEVLAELKWDARVRPNEIGVAVKDGVVTLADIADAAVRALEWDAFVIRGLLLELDITR